MTDLSPAAQAVWNAFLNHSEWEVTTSEIQGIAAALRAAADQFNSVEAMPGAPFCRNKLLAIANELENING